VLHEAEDSRNPWLERHEFLAIVSAHLDEFVMKRIDGLKQQPGAGVTPDACRLRPGISDLSGNVRVISFVGRFLKITRICCFRNAGEEAYFIDPHGWRVFRQWSSRPRAPSCDRCWRDNCSDCRNGWEMQSDGGCLERIPRNEDEQTGSQKRMIESTIQRVREATRYQRGKGQRPVAGRNLR